MPRPDRRRRSRIRPSLATQWGPFVLDLDPQSHVLRVVDLGTATAWPILAVQVNWMAVYSVIESEPVPDKRRPPLNRRLNCWLKDTRLILKDFIYGYDLLQRMTTVADEVETLLTYWQKRLGRSPKTARAVRDHRKKMLLWAAAEIRKASVSLGARCAVKDWLQPAYGDLYNEEVERNCNKLAHTFNASTQVETRSKIMVDVLSELLGHRSPYHPNLTRRFPDFAYSIITKTH